MTTRDSSSFDHVLSETRNTLLQKVGVVSASTPRCAIYKDDPSQMTGGRLLARFLSQFRWYYPAPTNTGGATDLDAAWAHYEHITLGRIYTDDPKDAYCRATPGDTHRPTSLYPLWSTPIKELGDFGISVRLYFSTITVLAAFLGVAGILNLPLSIYFWKDSYSSNKVDGLSQAVRASATCADEAYVECDDSCTEAGQLFANRWYGGDEDSHMVSKNVCNFDDWLWPGIMSFVASILLIVLFGIAFFNLQRKAEIVFDEEMQTASDYSVKIANPPSDAVDPEEWKAFFQTFGHVTSCTVAINNAELLNKLVLRRQILKKLSYMLPVDCDERDRDALRAAVRKAPMSRWTLPCLSTPRSLYRQIQLLEEDIRQLVRTQYSAVSVFCTFETERAQRNALHALGTGKLNVWRNRLDTARFGPSNRLRVQESAQNTELPKCDCNTKLSQVLTDEDKEEDIHILESHSIHFDTPGSKESLEDVLRFRGKHVVDIREAGEPNDVRWRDLQVPSSIRFFKFAGSIFALIWFIAWSGFFIYGLERSQSRAYYTPIFITITNIIVPKICEMINALEAHSTEQERQRSLYIKVCLFRWFNSAIALTIVTGFTETLSPTQDHDITLNQAVYNLIYAEMFTSPIIKMCDIMGFVKKHIMAPRARDQDEMNACFIGGKFELAERYTDATKVLFVALFYSAVLPQSLFLGAAALMVHFVVGKFCLLRMWRPSPDIGSGLSRLSRNYFFSSSLLIHVIMSAYFWSGYPYDNLCPSDDGGYVFCNQDFLRRGVFPPLPRFQKDGAEWMSDSQVTITSLYAWTALVMVVLGILVVVKENCIPFVESFFKSSYEPDGMDQGIAFSSVIHSYEVHGYVPQIREPGFAYPLLVSDISKVDANLLGWKDPLNRYEYHSLAEDARAIIGCETAHVVFSQIRHWAPTKLVK